MEDKLARIAEIYGKACQEYYENHPEEIKHFTCYVLGCLDPECRNAGCGNIGCPVHRIISYNEGGCLYCNNIPIKNSLWIPAYDRRPTLCQKCFKAYLNFSVSCPECKGPTIFNTTSTLRKSNCYWCHVPHWNVKSGNIEHICKCE